MRPFERSFGPAEAAARLGVSAKALRLYEQRGLIAPDRSRAGWRVYGSTEMARAGEIVALRALGLSLGQIARALDGDAEALEAGLAAHEGRLEAQARQVADALARLRRVRADLRAGQAPAAAEAVEQRPMVAFDLPWPWGGEPFVLRDIQPLTFITGPLGSGKTRLATRIVETLPGGRFLGLDRSGVSDARVEHALEWLVEDGATRSEALVAVLAAIEAEGPLVIDMVEQDLDQATQEALVAHLRLRPRGNPVFLLTRSSAILDLDAVGSGETILLCPANHGPPLIVAPRRGAPGFEAVATCLATPEVRARTAGVIAWRPQASG